MVDQIPEIVAELPNLDGVGGVWELVDRRFAQGDAAFLADLGTALVRAYESDAMQVWQYPSVFDHLLRSLALTRGPDNAAQTLRLAAGARAGGRDLDRYAASLLAAGHRAADLAAVFTGDGVSGDAAEELRACLVHELVLRGVAVAETPGIAGWATSPDRRRHPLGRLPLTLSDLEARPPLPRYSVNGTNTSMRHVPLDGHRMPVDVEAPVPPVTETTKSTESASIMAAAVANWADESNGRIEARVFDLAARLEPDSVPNTLMALGLECLNGRESMLSVGASTPAQAWRALFAAASMGGAYNSGYRGAYGRLAAWHSLAGLAGTAEGASVEEVEARARDCAWYGFTADTDWFEDAGWHIGLAVVTPDGRRLAVLAATDTD